MECGWKDLEVWYFGDEGGEKIYNKKGVQVTVYTCTVCSGN